MESQAIGRSHHFHRKKKLQEEIQSARKCNQLCSLANFVPKPYLGPALSPLQMWLQKRGPSLGLVVVQILFHCIIIMCRVGISSSEGSPCCIERESEAQADTIFKPLQAMREINLFVNTPHGQLFPCLAIKSGQVVSHENEV